MAVTIPYEYLVADSYYRVTLTTAEICDVFVVEGLTPDYTAKVQALAAINAVIPFASIHPANARMIADDFQVKPFINSPTKCKVYVYYHPIDWSSAYQPRITFTGTSREVLTNFSFDGSLITVNYLEGASSDPGAHVDGSSDGIATVLGQVARNKKYGILEIERVEYTSPRPKLVYLDRMNSDIFWGQPAYTWLVNNIVISKLAYTSGFNVRYLLEYDPQTHIKTAVYRDEITGTIPRDVNTNPNPLIQSGNGWRNAQVNGYVPFFGLSLPDDFI